MARLKLAESEDDVKKLVFKWFKDRDGWSFAPVSRGMGVHGIPDRVGCVPIIITQEMVGETIGLFVGIEAKKPGRRGEQNAGCSGLQTAQLFSIAEAGGIAYVVDSESDLGFLTGSIWNIKHVAEWIFCRVNDLKRRLGHNG